jgi:CO dehydrogenase/acetyl-CoA synthase alpha subunit
MAIDKIGRKVGPLSYVIAEETSKAEENAFVIEVGSRVLTMMLGLCGWVREAQMA